MQWYKHILGLRAIRATREISQCTVLFACVFGCYMANATTWYVAANGGHDSNDGKTAKTAFVTIQKAIDMASAGDTINVADGTYSYIEVSEAKEPLTIKATGPVDKCVIKGANQHRAVSIGNGITTNVFIDGFTITGGRATYSRGSFGTNGGGIAGGTACKCVIVGNYCGSSATGGGAYKAVLNECIVSNNTVDMSLGWTGGIDNCVANRCLIIRNRGKIAGGAASSILTDCRICENAGISSGVDGCTSYRCLIKDNISTDRSYSTYSWRATGINGGVAYNCIVANNQGWKGAGLNGGTVYNCVFLDNGGAISSVQGGSLYNCIVGSTSTSSNIINGANMVNCRMWNMAESGTTKISCSAGDPGLKSYMPVFGSPCIDAGNNLYASVSDLDFAGNPRIANDIVDIGAYEWQPAPAEVKNITATPRYPWSGDVDVSFTIAGDAGTAYATTFVAKDVAGGTNLVMKTVEWVCGGLSRPESAPYQLTPGVYHFVWKAGADLPDGTKFDRVAIIVEAK